MGKVKILSPVHIGSGNTYYVAYQKDNYIYSLENVIETLDPSEVRNQKLLLNLQNSKNMSRDEFISKFKFDFRRKLYWKMDETRDFKKIFIIRFKE